MPWVDQVISIFAATNGYLDDIPIDAVSKFEKDFLNFINSSKSDLRKSIEKEVQISDQCEKQLISALDEFVKTFSM